MCSSPQQPSTQLPHGTPRTSPQGPARGREGAARTVFGIPSLGEDLLEVDGARLAHRHVALRRGDHLQHVEQVARRGLRLRGRVAGGPWRHTTRQRTTRAEHLRCKSRESKRWANGFGWEIAHEAASRCLPIPLSRNVSRTHMSTYDATVWDLSIVQKGAFLSPRAKALRTIRNFYNAVGHAAQRRCTLG